MPKMKTKSAMKKRVLNVLNRKKKVNSNGESKSLRLSFVVTQAGKQHNMRNRSSDAIRELRGTTKLGRSASTLVGKLLPYARCKKYN